MCDDRGLRLSEVLDEPEHIGYEKLDAVIFDSRRLVTQVVAAHVRRDDVITLSQHRQLMPPRIPELRKAVQQYDETIVAAATFRVMQTHVVDVCKAVINRHLALWLHDRW